MRSIFELIAPPLPTSQRALPGRGCRHLSSSRFRPSSGIAAEERAGIVNDSRPVSPFPQRRRGTAPSGLGWPGGTADKLAKPCDAELDLPTARSSRSIVVTSRPSGVTSRATWTWSSSKNAREVHGDGLLSCAQKPALNSTSTPSTMADRIRHSDDRACRSRPRFARRRKGRRGDPLGCRIAGQWRNLRR